MVRGSELVTEINFFFAIIAKITEKKIRTEEEERDSTCDIRKPL
jgi:hypothetical protein